MFLMILKMSAVTAGNILLTYVLWRFLKNRKMNWGWRLMLAAVFGGLAILATHFGVDYQDMMINVRDLAPLTAGLFFDPVAGIIAGFIGGIERFIAGTYFGVGSYTKLACSISTCLSGLVAALLRVVIFRGKKPSMVFSFFIGSTMEVFHMYVVFITHRSDMNMAYYVVKTCAPPMIIFTGIGLALISLIIRFDAGEWVNPKSISSNSDIHVSQRFQFWLFLITALVLISNLVLGYILQTQVAVQKSDSVLKHSARDIGYTYNAAIDKTKDFGKTTFSVGETGGFSIFADDGNIIFGEHTGDNIGTGIPGITLNSSDQVRFSASVFGTASMCTAVRLGDGNTLLVFLPNDEVYNERDHNVYETVLADILLFTVIYILISVLVQKIVVNNLEMVNRSLRKITNGNLNEVVSVYSSSEFASLSNDINQTVDVLKTYIEAAEKRIEQELEFAKSIQESALPHNFTFPRNDLEIFASMDPAKEVGGDFYDFFFVDSNKLCLVIADVSGKGIPAALFMMRSKAIIRSYAESGKTPSEIFRLANNGLCDGNDADMFVTVWIGLVDLETGHMVCSNAGHEYPVLRRADGEYELYKQKHNFALAVMRDAKFREYELDLKPGDSLFVYTDGVPEAINGSSEEYGTGRLLDVLNKYKELSQKDILKYVRRDIRFFVGDEDQFDDVTMIGFKYNGPS
ncbi:MAG: SpoIIE family protein phosphatase [Lachnospiraceae bacterium]|nr:SpoIIE family protein phosphatase [Lachnospiraceae bacterium]